MINGKGEVGGSRRLGGNEPRVEVVINLGEEMPLASVPGGKN